VAQPDDLVTSWAQYKAFANHAEKFNKTPEDVSGPGTSEPVKVTHEGPGTHGAGGGGSGGGAVGQGAGTGSDDRRKSAETRESDVVDGAVPGAGTAGKKTTSLPGGTSAGASVPSDAAGAERKPSGPQDPWADWEREEMEELLGEIRGHLGE
jgi:phospholipase D1/2